MDTLQQDVGGRGGVRERVIVALCAAIAGLAALFWYPVRIGVTRVSIVALLAVVAVLVIVLVWRRKKLRFGVLAAGVLVGLVMVLPGRQHDAAALREAYARALVRFDGTKYVWGGETHRGVDCSGLVRAAMMDAMVQEGIRTVNPKLLREAVWMWWHDASAGDFESGYEKRTSNVAQLYLVDLSEDRVAKGDLAVTTYADHVLAYVGDGRWIDADPTDLRVEIIDRKGTSHWLQKNVKVMRWRWLE